MVHLGPPTLLWPLLSNRCPYRRCGVDTEIPYYRLPFGDKSAGFLQVHVVARGGMLNFRIGSVSECTKIAHRRSLAIFAADEGIAGNSAARAIFTHFIRRRNRGSLAIFFAEEIAHLGASKNRAIF